MAGESPVVHRPRGAERAHQLGAGRDRGRRLRIVVAAAPSRALASAPLTSASVPAERKRPQRWADGQLRIGVPRPLPPLRRAAQNPNVLVLGSYERLAG